MKERSLEEEAKATEVEAVAAKAPARRAAENPPLELAVWLLPKVEMDWRPAAKAAPE